MKGARPRVNKDAIDGIDEIPETPPKFIRLRRLTTGCELDRVSIGIKRPDSLSTTWLPNMGAIVLGKVVMIGTMPDRSKQAILSISAISAMKKNPGNSLQISRTIFTSIGFGHPDLHAVLVQKSGTSSPSSGARQTVPVMISWEE